MCQVSSWGFYICYQCVSHSDFVKQAFRQVWALAVKALERSKVLNWFHWIPNSATTHLALNLHHITHFTQVTQGLRMPLKHCLHHEVQDLISNNSYLYNNITFKFSSWISICKWPTLWFICEWKETSLHTILGCCPLSPRSHKGLFPD